MSAGEKTASIDRVRTAWQHRAGRELTDEDCREIQSNVLGFFALLSEWSRAESVSPSAMTEQHSPK